jgi:lysyl-tRNA synthetase class 2
MTLWQPSASLDRLAARATLNAEIRAFFAARQVLEVETPLLAPFSGTDPAIDPITATYHPIPVRNLPEQQNVHSKGQTLYLQTSPEFAMKRLIAAGSGSIYQLGKAVRNGEKGVRHNPEFTMLEWYRVQFSLEQLIMEVTDLLATVTNYQKTTTCTYKSLFQKYLGINPHTSPDAELQALLSQHLELHQEVQDRATCLDLLFAQVIEPKLMSPTFIIDYPRCMAALAEVVPNKEGELITRRFELIVNGMEIANGYQELCDASEQRQRMFHDQQVRSTQNLPQLPIDEAFIAALDAGMPACAGVALGVDRLLMLVTGATTLAEVLAFPLAD